MHCDDRVLGETERAAALGAGGAVIAGRPLAMACASYRCPAGHEVRHGKLNSDSGSAFALHCGDSVVDRTRVRRATHTSFLLLACAPGCTPLHRDYPVNHGRWGERIVADAGVMPAYWLRFDRENESDPRIDVVGPGYSARVGIGNVDQSIGLLYHGAFLEEDDGAAEVDVHALFLDFDVSVPVEPDGQMFVHAGAGLGMTHLDSPDPALDTTTGAANLRVHLEVRPWERVAFSAGVGAFAFGSAGDTDAYGTFFDLGMRLTF